jgi:hypothetical protein
MTILTDLTLAEARAGLRKADFTAVELTGFVRFQGSLPRVPPAGRFPGPGFERSREPR